jgi:hypothetical protein
MGKTEFLKLDFIPGAEQAGYLTAYVNFWEDRREPATALVEALFFAIEPHGLDKFLKKLKRPIKKVKASGAVPGIGEGVIEAERAEAEKSFSGTALTKVMRQFDKQKKRLILVIDEAQVLANEEQADCAHALRAALDVRKDRIKVIFAGSSETTLRRMFARPAEPFYNWAPLEPFELLGRDFVESLVEKVNNISKHPLSVVDALRAFDALNRTPEFFRRYLERYLIYPFEGSITALQHTREHVFNDGNFHREWENLLPADRAILLMLADGVQDLHSKAARERLGKALGLDRATDLNTPQHALRRLQAANVITKMGHGEYSFEDETLREWIRNRED